MYCLRTRVCARGYVRGSCLPSRSPTPLQVDSFHRRCDGRHHALSVSFHSSHLVQQATVRARKCAQQPSTSSVLSVLVPECWTRELSRHSFPGL